MKEWYDELYGWKRQKNSRTNETRRKIAIPNFDKMVENYFKTVYSKEGCFNFLFVEYEFYDKDYKIYNIDMGCYVSRP